MLMMASCHSYQSMNIPQGKRYVILCTDSFDLYYDINTLIYYCEEMKNPQSPLYNEWYAKPPQENVMLLKDTNDDIKVKVNGPSLPSFDSQKSESDKKMDYCAYYSVKDTEYLFYKYKNILIKKHDNDSVVNNYKISIREGAMFDIVEIRDKGNNDLVYRFYWEQWWGKVGKKKFK